MCSPVPQQMRVKTVLPPRQYAAVRMHPHQLCPCKTMAFSTRGSSDCAHTTRPEPSWRTNTGHGDLELRAELESKTSDPPLSMRLPTDYRGHNLTGPLLNTDKNPGAHRQVVSDTEGRVESMTYISEQCKGCPREPCPPPQGTPRRGGVRYKGELKSLNCIRLCAQ
jgi:hypothetical protein